MDIRVSAFTLVTAARVRHQDGARSVAPALLDEYRIMTTEEVEQITAAMNAVRSIVRALRVSSRMIEGKMGMSGAQLFVLQQLDERPAESLNDLAERTATHQSSVSVVVRRLVERGYVTRTASETDRRRVELALTPLGVEVLAGAPTTVQVKLLRGARALSPEHKASLAMLLQAWVQAAGLEDGAPPLLMDDAAGGPEATL
jgi:MarR family transcriptional regulator, lower aerobic nicotinate degradation pathway regulator